MIKYIYIYKRRKSHKGICVILHKTMLVFSGSYLHHIGSLKIHIDRGLCHYTTKLKKTSKLDQPLYPFSNISSSYNHENSVSFFSISTSIGNNTLC